jgi:hypothetical protein
MFSDHMQKFSRFPQTGLLIAAGGLVIVCQLVAMALVADRQVQRAGVRDLQRVAQQLAFADCIQRSTGPARHGCLRQSQLESDGGEPVVARPANEQTFAIKNVASAGEAGANDTADIVRVGIAGN